MTATPRNINAMAGHVPSLKTTIRLCDMRIAELESQFGQAQAEAASLRSELATARSLATSAISSLIAECGTLRAQLASMTASRDDFFDLAARHARRIDALQNHIDNARTHISQDDTPAPRETVYLETK